MARMRYLKPEFWTDSVVIRLSPFARLMFQGTWNFAMCESGHLYDDPLQLKMQVLPADDVDPFALVDELVESGRLLRFEGTDGRKYLRVKRLPDHQKVDSRWSPRCPGCRADPSQTLPNSPEVQGVSENSPEPSETQPNSPQEGIGGEGRGKEKKTSSSTRKRPALPLPADWTPTENHVAQAAERGLDLNREVFRFRNHAESNDRRQASWNAAFTMWLDKASDFKPKPPSDDWRRFSEQ